MYNRSSCCKLQPHNNETLTNTVKIRRNKTSSKFLIGHGKRAPIYLLHLTRWTYIALLCSFRMCGQLISVSADHYESSLSLYWPLWASSQLRRALGQCPGVSRGSKNTPGRCRASSQSQPKLVPDNICSSLTTQSPTSSCPSHSELRSSSRWRHRSAGPVFW